MDEIALGAILKRIASGLETSRNNIKKLSDEIAEDELNAMKLQDELNLSHSTAFVEAATEINQNGKLVNPNIDSQKAATLTKLNALKNYTDALNKHRELLKAIQIKRNTIICEHEKRGDLKTEAQLLSMLGNGA